MSNPKLRSRISLTAQFFSLFFFTVALPTIGVFVALGGYIVQKTRIDQHTDFLESAENIVSSGRSDLRRFTEKLYTMPVAPYTDEQLQQLVQNLFIQESDLIELSIYQQELVNEVAQFRPIVRMENKEYLKSAELLQGSLFAVNIGTSINPQFLVRNQLMLRKVFMQRPLPLVRALMVRHSLEKVFVVTAHFRVSSEIVPLLEHAGMDAFIIDQERNFISILDSPNIDPDDLVPAFASHDQNSFKEGHQTWQSPSRRNYNLYSADLHIDGMWLVLAQAHVPWHVPLRYFFVTALVIMMTILGFGLMTMLYFSWRLGGALRELETGIEKVAQGFWETKITTRLSNEIAQLATKFNKMTERISRAIRDKGNKEELSALRNMQKTLFPSVDLVTDSYEISSFFRASQNGGGDWWHYFLHNDHIILASGAVNQEGIAAALLKASSQSFFSTIEGLLQSGWDTKNVTPKFIISRLNHVIHRWAKGSAAWRFFTCDIDLKTGVIQYSNLSYSFPFVCRTPSGGHNEARSKDHITAFDGSSDGFLGEKENIQSHDYKELLHPGDVMVLIGPGLLRTDSKDMEGRVTKFKQIIAQHAHKPAKEIKQQIQNEINNDSDLAIGEDKDISFVVLKVFDRIFLEKTAS